MKRLMALMVMLFCMCGNAWGLSTERSGLIYYPTDGASAIAINSAIESRGYPATIKFTFDGSGVSKAYILTSGVTFSELVTLEFENGAIITGATAYVSGTILDTKSQIHTGNLAFTTEYQGHIRPEWQGRDDEALNWAIAASFNSGTTSDFGNVYIYKKCPDVILSGEYPITNKVNLKAGVDIISHNAVIKAASDIDTMLGYPESGAAYSGVYGQRVSNISGYLTIDGDSKANKGLDIQTTAISNFSNITVVGCDREKWTDKTISIVGGANIKDTSITVSSIEGISEGDAFRIWNGSRYIRGVYIVESISDPTVDLIGRVQETVSAGASIDSFGAGVHYRSNQSKISYSIASNNDIGFLFTPNALGIAKDDGAFHQLFAGDNNIGAAMTSRVADEYSRCTFQHSIYENVIITDCKALDIPSLYNEINSDFISVDAETYPSIYASGAAINMSLYNHVSPTVGWYRVMVSDCWNMQLTVTTTEVSSAIENPTQADDYSYFMLVNDLYTGSSMDINLLYDNTFARYLTVDGIVVNDAYAFPYGKVRLKSMDWAIGVPIELGDVRILDRTTGFYVPGDTKPLLEIDTDGFPSTIKFGSGGTSAVDTTIFRPDREATIQITRFLNLSGTASAPTSPSEGDIARADGFGWDPLSLGAPGYYTWYNGTTWVAMDGN